MRDSFTLDPRLEAESFQLGELPLCRTVLYDDARFPWIVLVPRQPGLVEIIDLSPGDRAQLIEEIATASGALKSVLAPHKINVAALGNSVRQLHVHVIARSESDPAWPSPVWGRGERMPYEHAAREHLSRKLIAAFEFD